MSAPIILDVSRLLSRAARGVPTGIDRVEHAYATALLAAARSRLHYAAVHPLGRFSPLPTGNTRAFIDRLGELWQHAPPPPREPGSDRPPPGAESVHRMAKLLRAGMLLPPLRPRFLRHSGPGRPIYVLVSHHHLHQPDTIMAAKRRMNAAFVCFIQDLVPIEFPEYCRPLEGEKHRLRIETAARLADAILAPTHAVRAQIQPYVERAGRDIPIVVLPLGVHPTNPEPRTEPQEPPYFLCISTIEPRKNHLLLFNVWRRLFDEMGDDTPRLVLVGQRGWENEMVLDVLERSSLRRVVTEHNALPDAEVKALVAGARAVLLPSFAEGYGLPLVEAFTAGTPVLCSDIAPFREVGGVVPEYIDTLDGVGWLAAVRDYAVLPSPRRARQIERISHWQAPSWPGHIDAVLDLIDRLPPESVPGPA